MQALKELNGRVIAADCGRSSGISRDGITNANYGIINSTALSNSSLSGIPIQVEKKQITKQYIVDKAKKAYESGGIIKLTNTTTSEIPRQGIKIAENVSDNSFEEKRKILEDKKREWYERKTKGVLPTLSIEKFSSKKSTNTNVGARENEVFNRFGFKKETRISLKTASDPSSTIKSKIPRRQSAVNLKEKFAPPASRAEKEQTLKDVKKRTTVQK
jgi:hypothetical protein